jgi:cytochrome P450
MLERYDVCCLARHADVQAVLRDHSGYASGHGAGITDLALELPWREPSLPLESDPPAHNAPRAVMNKALSARALRRLTPMFEQEAKRLIDQVVMQREIDAISDLAEAYALLVFPDVVGIQREGRHHLLQYGDLVLDASGPHNARFKLAKSNAKPALDWMTAHCRRAALSPGCLGAQMYEAADAGIITTHEAFLLVRSLLTASVETTVAALGNALYCLASRPGAWGKLRDNPGLARSAFEEAVRLESPVQTCYRTSARTNTLAQHEIPEGMKLLLFVGSANRDPERWGEPDRYEIERDSVGHLGFGSGIHACVGQLLARLEGELILRALAKRVRTLQLTAAPTRKLNNTLRGFATLPIIVGPK